MNRREVEQSEKRCLIKRVPKGKASPKPKKSFSFKPRVDDKVINNQSRRRAQGVIIDFIVGFTLFITIFLINNYTWNSIEAKLQNNEGDHYFKTSLYDGVEELLKTNGVPRNWETDNTSITAIGLAVNENVLSIDKLNTLQESDYETLKDYFLSTGDYQLIIKNNTDTLYELGRTPRGEIVRVERLVKIEDEYYQFIFNGWRA